MLQAQAEGPNAVPRTARNGAKTLHKGCLLGTTCHLLFLNGTAVPFIWFTFVSTSLNAHTLYKGQLRNMASSTQTEITETMSPKLELKAEKSPQTAPTTHGEAPEQISQPVPPFAANDRIAEDDISQAPETRSFPLTNEKQDIAGQVPLRFYASGHQGTNPPVNANFPKEHGAMILAHHQILHWY